MSLRGEEKMVCKSNNRDAKALASGQILKEGKKMRAWSNWLLIILGLTLCGVSIWNISAGEQSGGTLTRVRQETVKSGTITETETWSGVIRMTGDVTIAATGKVTIQAGTLIKADPATDDQQGGARKDRVELIVDGGSLVVEGEEGNPVTFTTTGGTGEWYGIRIVKHAGEVVIKNCKIEKAINGIEVLSSRVDVFPTIEKVRVEGASGTGIYIKVGSLSQLTTASIKGCVTKGNGGSGLVIDDSRKIILEGCDFSSNAGHGAGVYGSDVEFVNCTFSGNRGRGMEYRDSSVMLKSCNVQNNAGDGIGPAGSGSLVLDGCTVQGNGGRGISGDGWAWGYGHFYVTVNLKNCTIVSNGGDWGVTGRPVVMRGCVVKGNKNGVYHLDGEVTVVDSDIENNEGWGLYIAGGSTGRDGIRGNKITGNKRGIGFGEVANPFTGVEGNDIYGNSEYEAVNEGGSAIVTENTFWGEPTTTEIREQLQRNGFVSFLSKIFDSRHDTSKGFVVIKSYRPTQDGSPETVVQGKSGAVTTAETWSGTIMLSGDVTVKPGGSVRILAGTVVKAIALQDDQAGGANTSKVELIVDGGEFKVEGEENNPVVFTTTGWTGEWYGIRIVKHAGEVVIKNCKIEKAINGIEVLSSRVDVFPTIEKVRVEGASGTGIYIKVGSLSQLTTASIKGCVTKGNGGSGLVIDDSRKIILEGCDFSSNAGHGAGVYGSDVEFVNCTFSGNRGRGMEYRDSSVMLKSCNVQNNAGDGIGPAGSGSLVLDGCTVQGNGGRGISGDGWAWGYGHFYVTVNLKNCTIVSNGGDWGVTGRPVVMRGCVVKGNKNGVYHLDGEVTVVDSDIENNEGWGLYIAGGSTGRDGIRGNKITGNKRGIGFGGVANPFTGVEGNDIYGNSEYEAVNEGGSAIVTENTFWGEPTTTEIRQNIQNLTKIYDRNDDGGKGEIRIASYRTSAMQRQGTLLTLNAGLFMLSSPVKMRYPWHEVLGIPEDQVKIAIWDAETGQYKLYPNMTSDERLPTPGRAIWVKLNNSTQITLQGLLPSESEKFLVPLKPGWNMVGVPWQVKWRNLKVKKGDRELSLADAADSGWVYDVLWSWNGEKYEWVWARESVGLLEVLEPFKGYWILALEECNLVIPPKDEATRGSSTRGRLVTGNTFIFELQASNGKLKQSVWLGYTQGSRGGLIIPQPPEPPEPSELKVFTLDKEGKPSVINMRTGLEPRTVWDVVVQFSGKRKPIQEEITLTWDGIGYFPKDMSLTLIDLSTGTRKYLRTQTAYRFIPAEGEVERRFKLIAEQTGERVLRIINLQATPLRGQGVLIQFALTKPAVTQVEVLSLTGRKIATVEMGQTRQAGQNTILWRGNNANGHLIPVGVYLIRINAQDEEGRQVQATRTVIVR
jgi:hypothetical protein